MALTCPELQLRYINYCRRRSVPPNQEILTGFAKAEITKFHTKICRLDMVLDHLIDVDIHPLLDILMDIEASEIDSVDVSSGSSCMLSGEYALSLIRATNKKLRAVNVQDWPFEKEFLRDLSRRGVTCQILNLRYSHFRKLNLTGDFVRLHTLNLDFSTSLMSFQEDCFSCMPNLMRLSMCETRVSNLWTTIAALSKLPSLVELRFQKCLCCNDTGACPASSIRNGNSSSGSKQLGGYPYFGEPSESSSQGSQQEVALRNLHSFTGGFMSNEVQSPSNDDSSDDSDVDFSIHQQEDGLPILFDNTITGWNEPIDLQYEEYFGAWTEHGEESLPGPFNARSIAAFADIPIKYMPVRRSPICFEKHYREHLIASLPRLNVLDNLFIKQSDKENANHIFSQYFEYLPYKRKHKESVVSILQKREIKASCNHLQSPKLKGRCSSGNSQFYSRSLCAAKMGSSAWPFLQPLSISGNSGDAWITRPRQFEYHPSNSSLMAFGTLDGEVFVVNHESGKTVAYISSLGAMNSVLGICWLKKHPSKLIAGSDNGSLKLYDTEHQPSIQSGVHGVAGSVTFDEFDQLTSVHVNSTDELFLASGYSRNVALYDINTRRRLQVFTDMHREHINVVKFSHHSPSIFATSSFDQDVKLWDLRQNPMRPCYTASSSRGNVMLCFSPDDHYLLVSAVDNEVKQLLVSDGRIHLDFEIASTGSSQNYTRSYYMNGRDYIISGSCDEHVVRVCCSQTGRRLRDISLEGKNKVLNALGDVAVARCLAALLDPYNDMAVSGRGSRTSMFVQSLRGDPFRDFNMSILAAYMRPSSKSEIVKVNLLASNNFGKEYSYNQHSCPSSSMGG